MQTKHQLKLSPSPVMFDNDLGHNVSIGSVVTAEPSTEIMMHSVGRLSSSSCCDNSRTQRYRKYFVPNSIHVTNNP